MNRASAAYDAACTCIDDRNIIHPDFSVGLEGGLEKQFYQQNNNMTLEQSKEQNKTNTELWCMAWMAVLGHQSETCIAAKAEDDKYCSSSTDKNCRALLWGYAKTGSFLLPLKLSDLILNKKMELGHADDLLFERTNSKHGQGTVGRLTDGRIDRDEYYVHALKLALIPWIRPELYCDNRCVSSSTCADE
jgi:non-canonical (house-cleaning) NTP pyrophosphatase